MKFFRGFVLLVFMACCVSSASAQIGFSAGYSSVQTRFEYVDDFTGFSPSYFGGVDYWFRLKNYRVEFYPEISYLQSGKEAYINDLNNGEKMEHRLSLAAGKMNVRFYPLNFKGDCNCPTFSKQGKTFEKGFFLFLTAGVNQMRVQAKSDLTQYGDDKAILLTYGAGLGLDLGVTDFLTVTPFLRYERSATKAIVNLYPCPVCGRLANESYLMPVSVGIHTEFRWKKY